MTNARRILAQLSAKRVSGSSYTAADLADLRDACSLANASVSDKVRPESAKTGIFKAGVEFALDATAKRSQTGIIGDPVVFLSGLSEDVGVTPGKAGRLVSAAVAARLRADLLQAAAQRRTGEDGGAMMTLDGAIGVLQTFPFPKDAPELEMIAGGLKTRLSDGEREWLSNTFKSIGGGAVSDVVVEVDGAVEVIGGREGPAGAGLVQSEGTDVVAVVIGGLEISDVERLLIARCLITISIGEAG